MRRPLKPTLALFSISLIAACSGPNVHHELDADTDILVRQWTRSTKKLFLAGEKSAEYSNPVLYENTLVFGSQNVGLISLYPHINQVRWVLPISNGVSSELAVEGETVYFGGGDGYLYSANVETGRVNWRYLVRNPRVSKPAVSGGRVFVTTADDTVYAFDAGSGQWIWHYRRRSPSASTIHGASSPLVIGGEVMVGLSDGYIVSLSVHDGKLRWQKRLHQGRKFTDVDAHPVRENGVTYIPSYDGALYALRGKGQVVWRFDAGGSKQVHIEGKRIYLPSSDGTVYALQKISGKRLWSFNLDKGTPTRLALTPRYIIVGSSYQYLYVLDKTTGRPVYRYDVGYGSGFSGSPAYDHQNNMVYILSGGGNLMAFSVRKKRHKLLPGMTDPYKFL